MTHKHDPLSTVARNYDELANEYDDSYSKPLHLLENRLVAYLYNRHISGDVLDIGCGTGTFAHYFEYDEYVGVDVSKEMIGRTPTIENASFVVGDLRTVAFDREFDAVVSTFSGTGYVPRADVWNTVRNHLDDDGTFVLMFPSPQHLDGEYTQQEHEGLRPATFEELVDSIADTPLRLEQAYAIKPLDSNPPFVEPISQASRDRYVHTIVIGGWGDR